MKRLTPQRLLGVDGHHMTESAGGEFRSDRPIDLVAQPDEDACGEPRLRRRQGARQMIATGPTQILQLGQGTS